MERSEIQEKANCSSLDDGSVMVTKPVEAGNELFEYVNPPDESEGEVVENAKGEEPEDKKPKVLENAKEVQPVNKKRKKNQPRK